MVVVTLRRPPVPRLNAQQWVLGLLAAQPERPIRGKTLVAAELISLSRREVPDIAKVFRFSPSMSALESSVLDFALNDLASRGLVARRLAKEESGPMIIDRTDYRLTPEGFKAASEVFSALDPRLQKLLGSYRERLDDMGVWTAFGVMSEVPGSRREAAPAP